MKQGNLIRGMAFEFAIEIVKLSRKLIQVQREFVLSRQVLRSGTSIGANIEEAQGGQSRRDFIAKLYISYKEALETAYWLRLLKATETVSAIEVDALLPKAEALCKLLSRILQTSKERTINNY
jgi:four helix bundle protein